MSCKNKALLALIGSLCAVSFSTAHAEPSAMAMADTCAGCHGTDGQSAGPAIPSLAGMSATYFTDAMLAYKALEKGATHGEGARPATIMNRIAKGYSDEQIEAMGEYFASLPVYTAEVPHDAAKAKAGAAIYDDACSACHDESGSLPDDDAGILAGQWLPWLQYSVADFKAGHREQPKKMAKELGKLSDADVDAVLNYFASQKK